MKAAVCLPGVSTPLLLLAVVLCLVPAPLATPSASAQQVWDVDRLIRARNPGAVFTTTERDTQVTWQTLRSITYSPTLGQGAVGSASVQEASLVRSFKNPYDARSGGRGVWAAGNLTWWCLLAVLGLGRG